MFTEIVLHMFIVAGYKYGFKNSPPVLINMGKQGEHNQKWSFFHTIKKNVPQTNIHTVFL